MPRPQSEPRTVLEYLIRQGNRTYAEECAEFAKLSPPATISPRHLAGLARGERTDSAMQPATRRALEARYGMPAQDLLKPWGDLDADEDGLARLRDDSPSLPATRDVPSSSAVDRIRRLRQRVDSAIGENALSEASLEDWEQCAIRLGAATRYRSSGPLLVELEADFTELERRIARRQPLSALRRLTVVTAQMAGLMSLTLLKLNQPEEARNWARTARIAADEADEPAVRAWVRAQEAYAHFYAGSLTVAIVVARQAQAAARGRPCVGVALAAALESRAHAALGHAEATHDALRRAEDVLAALTADEVLPSAFGYDEAQLRFHEGNALTHLHDTEAAWQAQQRALDLYPANDYMDRALIQLDRASCLAYDGDVSAAMDYATQTMLGLTEPQRTGLITLRGQQIFESLPQQQRALPAARDFHEVLTLNNDHGDDH